MINQLLGIAMAGSIGAVTRFGVANGIYALLGRDFPHGTLFVNVTGSFLMGLFTELMLQRFALAVEYRAALLVGFLGAYTTFSTFSLETVYLLESGNVLKAFLNVFLSVVLCLAACWMGLIWGRTLFTQDFYPWLGHGLPYRELMLSLVVAFMAAMAVETLLHGVQARGEVRVIAHVVLLSLLTLCSTLWLVFKLPEIRGEFHGLLSIFAINAFFGVAMVWLGSLAGNCLWHIKQSL
ncbi:fluoride efflux transporter CrcB [Methylomonas sp. SURF-2]|uniref:Fluoride-specific ion channel FluC n=1 Tax=Methylomonas subterranea TaxID=2952225 RepID=A0ABT1TLM1_9GAMM|nr:fluoride efflux transporter CrcB [Methylomonas sp. SURF-2]MCQ8106376.1 fluoride efflux transporter CrcB [Methylomonas sp. SURF-2]